MITYYNLSRICWLLLLLFMAAGCTTSSYNTDLSETLVIVYDDLPEEDWTKAFPVHVKYGVPGCIAVISETIGAEGHLSRGQIIKMQDAGWKIMAHGRRHAALRDIAITQDIEPGSQEIHVYFPHFIIPGYSYVIFANNQDPFKENNVEIRKVVEVRGKDYRDGLIVPDKLIKGHYERYQARVRPSYELAIEEIVGCKRDLQKIGAAVSSYVFPHSAYADWSVDLVSRYYVAARNGNKGDNGLNHLPLSRFDLYTLNSIDFEVGKLSRKEITNFLKKAHDKDLLCIFHAHSWSDSLTKLRIEFALETAKKTGVRVSTLSSALNLTSFQSVEE